MLTPQPDGTWALHLGATERDLLASLADQLDELIEEDPGDAGLRRLFPTAYLDDPSREEEFRLLAGDELRASRQAALEVLRTSARRDALDDDEATAWLQALNALRLVVGTRLDVSEEDDGDVPPDHPDAPLWAVYGFLTWLVSRTVTALTGSLGPPTEG
ncbi:MAG: hypothetical protein JWN46_3596 [Acidimicrobiales bacterium]|nr:hypothetical protein [Acidimicrobiales bacterium]